MFYELEGQDIVLSFQHPDENFEQWTGDLWMTSMAKIKATASTFKYWVYAFKKMSLSFNIPLEGNL